MNSSFLWRHEYPEEYFKRNMYHNYADAMKAFLKAISRVAKFETKSYKDECIKIEEMEKYNFKPDSEFTKDIDMVMLCAELLSTAVMSGKQGVKPATLVDKIIPELNETMESNYEKYFDKNGKMREELKTLINEKLIKYLEEELNLYEGDARRLVAYTRYCYISLKNGTMFHLNNKPLPGRIVFWEEYQSGIMPEGVCSQNGYV